MLRQHRLGTWDLQNQDANIDIPPFPAVGILLCYEGVNNELTAVAVGDLGQLRLNYDGQMIHSAFPVDYWIYDALRGGLPEATSTANAAFRFSVFLPFRYGGIAPDNPDDNVLRIRPNRMRLQVTGLTDADVLSSGVSVSVIVDESGLPRYMTRIYSNDVELTAAYGNYRTTVANLRHLMLGEPSGVGTLPASVSLKSSRGLYMEGPWDDMRNWTDLVNRVEAATAGIVLTEFGNANPASWMSGSLQLLEVGANAGDTQRIVEFGADMMDGVEYVAGYQAASDALSSARQTSSSPTDANVNAPVPSRNPATALSAPGGSGAFSSEGNRTTPPMPPYGGARTRTADPRV